VLHSDKIMPYIIDVDVINGYHHLREEEKGNHTSSESLMCLPWLSMNRKFSLTLMHICENFCELLRSIILSACLVWGFVASLAIFLVIHYW